MSQGLTCVWSGPDSWVDTKGHAGGWVAGVGDGLALSYLGGGHRTLQKKQGAMRTGEKEQETPGSHLL